MALQQKSTDTIYTLDPHNELRFEVAEGKKKLTLMLISGLAEIFGSELLIGRKYEFCGGAKIAVFTYQGCNVKVLGETKFIYKSKEAPMYVYNNCHTALEFMRATAVKQNRRGPVMMIVGSSDVGKSTVSQILLNYGVKMGNKPMFVDLDVDGGHISVPGTIGTMLVSKPSDVADGFSQENPLVFHFGHTTPTANITLYNHLVSRLAEICSEHLRKNKGAKSSGIIINTPGFSTKKEFQILTHAVQAFQVDVILVLDNEKLCNSLKEKIPDSVKTIAIPKSGGVVTRNKNQRATLRDQRVQKYFYGSKLRVYPHSLNLKWKYVKIYKIGAPDLPASCLPLGMNPVNNATKLVAVSPGPHLLHHVLSVISAKDNNKAMEKTVAGFFCVTNVDVVRRTITVLSPQPSPPPNTILLLSDVQFMDD